MNRNRALHTLRPPRLQNKVMKEPGSANECVRQVLHCQTPSETECVVTVADIADRRAIAEHPPGANTYQSPEQPPYSEVLLRRSSPLPLRQQDQGNACGTQVDVVPGKPEPNENRNEATSEELARFRGGQRRRKVCAKRSWQTQTTAIPSSSTVYSA